MIRFKKVDFYVEIRLNVLRREIKFMPRNMTTRALRSKPVVVSYLWIAYTAQHGLRCWAARAHTNSHSKFHLAISLSSDSTMPVSGWRMSTMRWTKSSATGLMSGRNVPTDCKSSIRRWTAERRRYHSSPLLRHSHVSQSVLRSVARAGAPEQRMTKNVSPLFLKRPIKS